MRGVQVVFSAFVLLLLLFFALFAAFLIAIALDPHISLFIVNTLQTQHDLLFQLGLSLLAGCVVMFIAFYFFCKKRFYSIELMGAKALIDETIIREYVTNYWSKLFPGEKVKLNVIVHATQKIEIVTRFPREIETKETLFVKIQNELGALLSRQFGYKKALILTIEDS